MTDARNKTPSDIEIEQHLARQTLDRSMLHRLLPLLQPIRRQILAVIGIELLLVFTVFLRPWFVRELLDNGLLADGGRWLLDERLVLWLSLAWRPAGWGAFCSPGCHSGLPGAQPFACSTTCESRCSPTSRHCR